ncbi:hypothetical protein EV189_3839 [Motilibacter rhizosphaerae]|uniref:HAF family extracellular repeat protein n=1 Tax=Motilibacter rhizosphaerae TaxID=598652 RepID=A0A4Q7NAR2_9ACTN|nr:hypothetical protein [Motilibacter rhizosphaerae]RZS79485.1 hypothetical protein EV189_3839 [Motilibacter rhizosphaerae]
MGSSVARRSGVLAVGAVVGVALAASPASAAVEVLPTPVQVALPAGALVFGQVGITDARTVVGNALEESTTRALAVSKKGVTSALPLSGGAVGSAAYAVDGAGDVAGALLDAAGRATPVVWHAGAGAPVVVPVPVGASDPAGTGWVAFRVTAGGRALLRVQASAARWGTLVWDGRTTRTVSAATAGAASRAVDVNDAGQLLSPGLDPARQGTDDAGVWTPGGGIRLLRPLPGTGYSDASVINSSGEVGGSSWDAVGQDFHSPTLWSAAGVPTALEHRFEGSVDDLDDHGDAVGATCGFGDDSIPCQVQLWHKGRLRATTPVFHTYMNPGDYGDPHLDEHGDVSLGDRSLSLVSRRDW